jgi:FixJ family two-component response regulator
MDLMLPDMNGADLLTALASRGLRLPALLLSGWPEARRVAEENGVAFLRKPFDLNELLDTVAKLVEEARVTR